MDDRIWKAWLAFVSEAAAGSEELGRRWKEFLESQPDAEAIGKWFAQWAPSESSAGHAVADDIAETVETWMEAMGVVPLAKYEALLAENEKLRRRLEETETRLREFMSSLSDEAISRASKDTREFFEKWDAATRELLEAQARWTKDWVSGWKSDEEKGKKDK